MLGADFVWQLVCKTQISTGLYRMLGSCLFATNSENTLNVCWLVDSYAIRWCWPASQESLFSPLILSCLKNKINLEKIEEKFWSFWDTVRHPIMLYCIWILCYIMIELHHPTTKYLWYNSDRRILNLKYSKLPETPLSFSHHRYFLNIPYLHYPQRL